MKDIDTTSDFEDEYQEVLSPKEALFFSKINYIQKVLRSFGMECSKFIHL